MGNLIVASQFGNNVSSDDITAAKNDIVKGKTSITTDSNDEIVAGTLELVGNANPSHVLHDKTFYNINPHTISTGTMPNIGAIDSAKSVSLSNGVLYIRMSQGAHITNATSGYPEVNAPQSTVSSAVGLSSGKIAVNNTILGQTGTYKGLGNATAADVRKGKTFSTASLSNAAGTMTEKAAATYTPKTTNQTITANQYLTGVQTIKGDANLVAGNIKQGVTIFGVTGTQKWINECAHVDLFNGSLSFSSSEKSLSLGMHETGNWIMFETGLTSPGSYSGQGAEMHPVGYSNSGIMGSGGFLRVASSVYLWVNVTRYPGGEAILKYNMATGSSRNVGIYVRKVAVTNGDINGW